MTDPVGPLASSLPLFSLRSSFLWEFSQKASHVHRADGVSPLRVERPWYRY